MELKRNLIHVSPPWFARRLIMYRLRTSRTVGLQSPRVPAPAPPRPFLKWAGGKRQLLPRLRQFLPQSLKVYREPFLGSGAVFFDLAAQGRLAPPMARLSDDNADLVGTYLRVRDQTEAVIDALTALERGHALDPRAHYYQVRDGEFNPAREAFHAQGGTAPEYPVRLAAMLLYLNRTGYNGLFRLNGRGGFNVPMGRYTRPRIVQAELLPPAAAALRDAEIACEPFEEALRGATTGDVVYLDPPYAPVSRTASFRAYTARGFARESQERLRDEVLRLAASGVAIVLSNSIAPNVVSLYDTPEARAAGLQCHRVAARRAINTRVNGRGAVEELVVTNLRAVEPHD
jgi:DNA adenine methylase